MAQKYVHGQAGQPPEQPRVHEHVQLLKEKDIPKTRDELYGYLGLKAGSRARKNLDEAEEKLLRGNARFLLERGVDFKKSPNILVYVDVPVRYDVLAKLFEGKRPIKAGHLMRSVNSFLELWNIPPEGKHELLDAMQAESAGKYRITDEDRGVLELRFGLNPEAGEDHPHTLFELGLEHKIRKTRVRELENKALLACKDDAFSQTRAFQACKHWVEHVVELEVPGYVLEAKVLAEPLRAPSALAHQAKGRLLDGHWGEIPEGVRAAGKEKLVQMPISDIIRGVLKKKDEQELLMEVYSDVGIVKTDSTHLKSGNPDNVIENLDWIRNKKLSGIIPSSTLVLRDLPSRHAVRRILQGDRLTASNLEKSISFHLEHMHVDKREIDQLLDAMEKGILPDGSETPKKYRITEDERKLLERRLAEQLRMTDLSGSWRSKTHDYLRWLENKAVLAACSPDMAQLDVHGKVYEYAKSRCHPDVSHDDALEIQWLIGTLLTADEKKKLGFVDTPSSIACREIGWQPIPCQKKALFRRAYELRKAVDVGWFNEEGGAAPGAEEKVNGLHLQDFERKLIAGYFQLVADAGEWSEVRAAFKSEISPRKKAALRRRFEVVSAHRNLRKPLLESERAFLDQKCRLTGYSRERWVRGNDWNEHTEVGESRASGMEPVVLAKISPFMPKDVSIVDELAKAYGSPNAVPQEVVDNYGLELRLDYRDWSEENEAQWRVEARRMFYGQLGRKSITEMPPEDLLQSRLRIATRGVSQRLGHIVFGTAHHAGRWREDDAREEPKPGVMIVSHKYTRTTHGTEIRAEDIPREKFPDAFKAAKAELEKKEVDLNKILAANRFRQVERPQGRFIEEIPFDEFKAELVKTYGAVADIPPQVLAEHGLEVNLAYKEEFNPNWEFRQRHIEAERTVRPVEPREVEVEVEEPAPVAGRARAGAKIRVPRVYTPKAPAVEEEAGAPPEEKLTTEALPMPEGAPPKPQAKKEEGVPKPAGPAVTAGETPTVVEPPEQPIARVDLHVIPVHIPHLQVEPITSPDSFDRLMHIFQNKFMNKRSMMEAVDIKFYDVQPELEKLRVRREVIEGQFEYEFRSKGELLPTCAVFLKTQSAGAVKKVFDHLADSLENWEEKGVKREDMPRMALCHMISHHMAVSAGLSTTGDERGNRYLRVGRGYERLGEMLSKTPGALGDTYKAVHERYVGICNAIDPDLERKIIEARRITLPSEPVEETRPPAKRQVPVELLETPVGEAVHIPGLSGWHAMNNSEFDDLMHWLLKHFHGTTSLMNAIGVQPEPVAAALERLQTGVYDFDRYMELKNEVDDMGQAIPAYAIFGATKPGHLLHQIAVLFGNNLTRWSRHVDKQELPRLALYHVLAYHMTASLGLSEVEGTAGIRMIDVGRGYQHLKRELARLIPHDLYGVYQSIEDKYVNIARAIDPKLDEKIVQAEKKFAEAEAAKTTVKPAGGVAAAKPVEAPPMNYAGFDNLLGGFYNRYQGNRFKMMTAAGLPVPSITAPAVREALDELRKSSEAVKNESSKIFTFASYLKTERRPEKINAILDHLENSLKGWKKKELTSDDLPRLALYRVLACEVGLGDGLAMKDDGQGRRYMEIGGEYDKFAKTIPQPIKAEYDRIEKTYIKLAKGIYPNL